MEYTSKGVGNAALTTGIIGTSLGALSSAGGIAGLLGLGGRGAGSGDPGDRPVTRFEMELYKEIADKNDTITLLTAEKYADGKADGLQAQINQNAVWSAGVTANLGFMAQQISQLFGITQLVVPNANIAPGWGPAAVRPFPPFPPVVAPTTPPAEVTSSTSTSSSGG